MSDHQHSACFDYRPSLTADIVVGFLIAEIPAALLMKVIPAQFVFGGAIVLFGLCATLISVSGGYAGIMVLRLILGAGEAVSSLSFLYLSMWYRPYELAFSSSKKSLQENCCDCIKQTTDGRPLGLTYLSTPIAGFTSGLVAYGVAKNLDGDLGYHAWQWLFIVEGIPAIALGLLVVVCLPDFPDKVSKNGHFFFRSQEERALIRQRFLASKRSCSFDG